MKRQSYVTALALLRHHYDFGASRTTVPSSRRWKHVTAAASSSHLNSQRSTPASFGSCATPVSTHNRHEVRMTPRSISRFLCLLAVLVAPLVARAQTGTIAGRVSDSTNAAPLAGATVSALTGMSVAGSATSGEDGSFRIVNLPAGTYVVAVRQLGYTERRVTGVRVDAGGTAQVNVLLLKTSTQLNPVVVTGGRSQPEKALDSPNSISVIETREIAERPTVTVADHLKGVPGVDVNAGGIAQANIVTRGFNNAFSGALLTLQDYRFAAVPSLRVNVPFLNTVTNEDIERIEVL